jgi:hypothetical protein
LKTIGNLALREISKNESQYPIKPTIVLPYGRQQYSIPAIVSSITLKKPS